MMRSNVVAQLRLEKIVQGRGGLSISRAIRVSFLLSRQCDVDLSQCQPFRCCSGQNSPARYLLYSDNPMFRNKECISNPVITSHPLESIQSLDCHMLGYFLVERSFLVNEQRRGARVAKIKRVLNLSQYASDIYL